MKAGLRLGQLLVGLLLSISALAVPAVVHAAGDVTYTPPADQTVHSAQDAAVMGRHAWNLGSFTSTGDGPWTVTADWGDGATDSYAPAPGPLQLTHAYGPGTHQVHVTITSATGSDAGDFNATLIDDGPTIFVPVDPLRTDEGAPLTLQNAVWDPAPDSPYSVHVDWGDGTSKDLSVSQVGVIRNLTHTYAATTPVNQTGNPHTDYTAGMTVTDAAGVKASASWKVVVADKTPVITAVPPVHLPENVPLTTEPITLATFTDASVGPWSAFITDLHGQHQLIESVAAPGPITIPGYYADWGNLDFLVYIQDRSGLMAVVTASVIVDNDPPAIGPISVSSAGVDQPDTGTAVIVEARYTDPSMSWYSGHETFTCTIDFGDGSGAHTLFSSEYEESCGMLWTYTTSGTYQITMTVTDSRGATGTRTTTAYIEVVNHPPIVGLSISNPDPPEGQPVSVLAYFMDPEAATETYTCTVDYGDGSGPVPGVVSGATCAGPDHLYTDLTRYYTVTVSVTDSGGASGQNTTFVFPHNSDPWVGGLGLVGDTRVGHTSHAVAAVVDPGSSFETYECWIVYGDGTAAEPGTWSPTGWSDGLPRCVFPDHSYSQPGQYTLRAHVLDGNGGSGQASFTETIVPDQTPVLVAPADQTVHSSADANHSGRHDFDLGTFTDPSGAAAGPWTVAVLWGDGAGSNSAFTVDSQGAIKAGHVYAPGTYTVEVWVENAAHSGTQATFKVTLVDDGPTVVFDPSPIVIQEGDVADVVTGFYDPAPDGPFAVHIDYGDGATEDRTVSAPGALELLHAYVAADPASPGANYSSYSVSLTVTDSLGETNTATKQVIVMDRAPILTDWGDVNLTEGPGQAQVNLVAFDDVSKGPWEVVIAPGTQWETHETFTTPGTVTIPYDLLPSDQSIEVLVIDRGGLYGSDTVKVHVANVAPQVSPHDMVTFGPAGVERSESVLISDPGLGSGYGETYTCTIDYGDGGGPQAGVLGGDICTGPLHAYASKGTYTFVATVTDSNGGVGTLSLPITIYNPMPTVGPVSAPAATIVGTAVTASAAYVPTGLDPADTCTVDYGDGSGALAGLADGASCTGPSHVYAVAGTFQIRVKVTAATGASASSTASIVVSSPPIAVGPVSIAGQAVEGASVTASAPFTPIGRQTYTCKVDYGDGGGPQAGTISGSKCVGRSHVYGRPGQYAVTVAVTGSAGLSGSATTTLSIKNVAPVITSLAVPTTVKLGSSVTATVTFTDPGTAETHTVSIEWMDGSRADFTLPAGVSKVSASHTYARTGLWSVVVNVYDGLDGASANSSINVYDPARVLTGSGTFNSIAGACTLSSKCAAPSTATFSLSAKYAKGATKPTVSFTMTATGLSVTATSADFLVVQDGIAYILGTAKVNGVSGYTLWIATRDGTPDWIAVQILDKAGNDVYNSGTQNLRSGSIVLK